MVRKKIRVATKVKDPETFEQKYNTIDGKILTSTLHTAWVQSFGKQPRLLRNCGVAFVPTPLIYGPCRPSRFSDNVAYKSARRSRPCLRFIDIEDPNAPHTKCSEDMETGLTRKMTRKEHAADNQEQSNGQNSPAIRRAKPAGRRTGGRPCNKPRGMSLNTIKPQRNKCHDKGHNRVKRNEEREFIDNIRNIRAITKTVEPKENSASNNNDISKYDTNKTISSSPLSNIGESIGSPYSDQHDRRSTK